MPIHDWTRVRANRFHDFHQSWTTRMKDALNAGVLPEGFWAMAEQKTGGPEPDIITLSVPGPQEPRSTGLAVLDHPPQTRIQTKSDSAIYAEKANRIAVYHPDRELISIIEIVSPGNKDSRRAMAAFARKAVEYLKSGVHVLIIDLFPPNPRNPQGIHKLIWDRIQEEPFELTPDKPLTLASYAAGAEIAAYVEPVGVGDALRDMPIFLTPHHYIPAPLETTYQSSWDAFPKVLKDELLASPLERG
jgi:hypothetical protein